MTPQLTKHRQHWLQGLSKGDQVIVVSGIKSNAQKGEIVMIEGSTIWVKADRLMPFHRETGISTYGRKHLRHEGALRYRADGSMTVI